MKHRTMIRTKIAAIVLSLLLLPNVGHALTMTIDDGLAAAYPGEHPDFYHVTFVAGGTNAPIFPMNLGANAIERAAWAVTLNAYQQGFIPDWDGIEANWRPFMSMIGLSAEDHIAIAGPLFNTQGDLVATDKISFFNGGPNSLVNPIHYNINGTLVPSGTPVMAGTSNGSHNGASCFGWEDGSGTFSSVSYSTTTLYDNSSGSCGSGGYIIGISPPIPWPMSQVAVPEPSTLLLGGISFLALFGFAYRKMMLRYEVSP